MPRRRQGSEFGGPDSNQPNQFDANQLNDLLNQGLAFARQYPALAIGLLLVVLVVGAVILWQNRGRFTPPTGTNAPTSAASADLLLGNPSGATTDPANRDNYLMVKKYFTLSYNNAKGIPNWVSWQVSRDDLGNAPRKQVFDPDTTLPVGFTVVTTHDYQGGGFDRGHMCPHSDRAANEEMSFSTFVMTNIIPQAPSVNQKAWAQLESYCRELVRGGNRLYVIAGPSGQGGRGSKGFAQSLAGGKVTVPADCWKVAVVVPESGQGPGDDLSRISMSTRVIAVMMPNDEQVVGEEWAGFRTSPARIEQATGYHFFDRVRPDVAQALRQKVDDIPIPPPAPMGHH